MFYSVDMILSRTNRDEALQKYKFSLDENPGTSITIFKLGENYVEK
jgi:hypothetical protein